MNEQYIHKMPHTVLYSETDARGLISLPAIFSLFQEGALLHAEQLGFGASYCQQEGLMWVLSRLMLELDAFPRHRSRLELHTWPKKPQGPFALRDFRIIDEDGTTLARATSSWLLLKLETMRPVRPQPLFAPYPLETLGDALSDPAGKISEDDAACKCELEVEARYSDLDQNMHVNNTRYVRWFLDCFSPNDMKHDGNLRFCINYLKEASFGDRIRLCRYDSHSSSTVRGFLKDGSQSFTARMWLPKSLL